MIPQKTVDQIIDRAKIEDVARDFIKLRRIGTNLVGLCPFHNEKTPSFQVSVAKNIAKCFGCSKGGDPIQFLREKEDLSFPDALRYLAKKYNIVIEEKQRTPEDVQRQQRKAAMYIANEFAATHFRANLYKDHKKKRVGQDYFEKRGFSKATIEKWKLGYNPDAGLLTTEMVKNGYDTKMLQELSLANARNTDFFRFRATFALQERRNGKIIAFAGRTLLEGEKAKKTPKYLNSKESELYDKSNYLYGLYHAKQAIRANDETILTEGYTDVISLSQAGIENVVASSGTALTSKQVGHLKRLSENVIILYDGDKAGIKAALKGLDLFLAQDMNVRICILPEGNDPDVYLNRVGKEAFLDYLKKESQDFILFKIANYQGDIDQEPSQKAELVEDILQSIAKIPNNLKREVYLDSTSKLMQLSTELLEKETEQMVEVVESRNLQAFAQQKVNQPKPDLSFLYTANETEEATICEIQVEEDFVEREVIDLLLIAGNEPFSEGCGFTIADYVLNYAKAAIHYEKIDNKDYLDLFIAFRKLNKAKKTIDLEAFKKHENISFRTIANNAGQTIILTDPTRFAIDTVMLLHLRTMNRLMINRTVKTELNLLKKIADTTTAILLAEYSKELVNDCIELYRERLITA